MIFILKITDILQNYQKGKPYCNFKFSILFKFKAILRAIHKKK